MAWQEEARGLFLGLLRLSVYLCHYCAFRPRYLHSRGEEGLLLVFVEPNFIRFTDNSGSDPMLLYTVNLL